MKIRRSLIMKIFVAMFIIVNTKNAMIFESYDATAIYYFWILKLYDSRN